MMCIGARTDAKRTKGHANPCICECKQTLPTGHRFVFGDDAMTAIFDPRKGAAR